MLDTLLQSGLPAPSHDVMPQIVDCPFTGGTACKGVLPEGFVTAATHIADTLWNAYQATIPRSALRGEHYRKSGGCASCQYAKTYVTSDARNFHIERLVGDQAIVIGAIRWSIGASRNDDYYHLGANDGSTGRVRHTVFVAFHPATGPGSTPTPVQPGNPRSDTVVGRWQLFGFSDDHQVVAGPSGNIVQCGAGNHEGDVPYFVSCPVVKRIVPIAEKHGVSLSVALELRRCAALAAHQPRTSGVEIACGANSNVLKARGLTDQQLLALKADLQREHVLDGDEGGTDPYWFPCAASCCTASMS